jgi:hypothetical protein
VNILVGIGNRRLAAAVDSSLLCFFHAAPMPPCPRPSPIHPLTEEAWALTWGALRARVRVQRDEDDDAVAAPRPNLEMIGAGVPAHGGIQTEKERDESSGCARAPPPHPLLLFLSRLGVSVRCVGKRVRGGGVGGGGLGSSIRKGRNTSEKRRGEDARFPSGRCEADGCLDNHNNANDNKNGSDRKNSHAKQQQRHNIKEENSTRER